MAAEVPLATSLMLLPLAPEPVTRVIKTVGAVPPMSKTNPAGALRMIVPVPALPLAFSVYVGPVKVVNVPVTPSAAIAPPPVAGVNCAGLTAMAGLVPAVLLPSLESLAVVVKLPVVPVLREKLVVPARRAAS